MGAVAIKKMEIRGYQISRKWRFEGVKYQENGDTGVSDIKKMEIEFHFFEQIYQKNGDTPHFPDKS